MDLKFRAVVSVDGSSLTATDPEGRTCHVEGPRPELARNVPLTGQALAQRLSKTGGTPFQVVEVRTHVDPGLTISAAAINAMRRDVLNQLTAQRARRAEPRLSHVPRLPHYKGNAAPPVMTVQITSIDQITGRLLKMKPALLYVPLHLLTQDGELCRKLVRTMKHHDSPPEQFIRLGLEMYL